MTGLAIVLALAAAAATAAWLRERRRAAEARRQLDMIERRVDGDDDARRHLFDVLAHELRSPLSAITGYQELLADGIYGTVDDRAKEALARIGNSAAQLLLLMEGMERLGAASAGERIGATETVDLAALTRAAVEAAAPESSARGVTVTAVALDEPVAIQTDAGRLRGALDLALFAAIKLSSGRELELKLDEEPDRAAIRIGGVAIDPDRDSPAAAPRSGAALRFTMADRLLDGLGGSLSIEVAGDDAGGGRVVLTLPRTRSE